jgi:hypothetical protein
MDYQSDSVFGVERTVDVTRGSSSEEEEIGADTMVTFINGEYDRILIPDELKESAWFTQNRELDLIWKQIAFNTDRSEVIRKLFPESASISEVPEAVSSFLAQNDFDVLNSVDFRINSGFNPPDIGGTFHVDNWTVKYDKGNIYPAGKQIDECDYTFSTPTASGELNVSYECTNDTGSGSGAFISGSNSCFTIYINQTGNYLGCNYTMPAIVSGCLDTAGLTDLQYAVVMKNKDNTQACQENMMPVGNFRTISIDDQRADRVR